MFEQSPVPSNPDRTPIVDLMSDEDHLRYDELLTSCIICLGICIGDTFLMQSTIQNELFPIVFACGNDVACFIVDAQERIEFSKQILLILIPILLGATVVFRISADNIYQKYKKMRTRHIKHRKRLTPKPKK